MKKILFVANIHKHFLAFHMPYIAWLRNEGYEVHVAANGGEVIVPNVEKQFNICIERSPFSFNNIKAYYQLKNIINAEHYSLVHCHTAMGGVIARLSAKDARKKKTLKVLYTVHGFHFFLGSPLKYWLMYFPIEYFLSRFTDAIITINQEDYDLIHDREFKNDFLFKIPGIGINTNRLIVSTQDLRLKLREKYDYSKDCFIMIYIAEHIERKNHKFIIDAASELKNKRVNFKILFAGRGRLFENNIKYAKDKQVLDYIDFLGFRTDIGELIALSDIGISASRQEGLGLNLAEELYSGLPVVASKDRGHKELVKHSVNGYLFEQNNIKEFVEYVESLSSNSILREQLSENALSLIQKFTLDNALKSMANIYKKFI